jgi:hypothetical protein
VTLLVTKRSLSAINKNVLPSVTFVHFYWEQSVDVFRFVTKE